MDSFVIYFYLRKLCDIFSNSPGITRESSCAVEFLFIPGGAKITHVFQITVTLFIFNIKKLCQHQNNL